MNGIHDLGGMHGFGRVDAERDEPVFHHEWERRAFALNLATGFLGRWNIDMGRFAREHMPPYYVPAPDSPEREYLMERRRGTGQIRRTAG